MDFSLLIDSLPIYLDGLWTTTWLVVCALIIGLTIAIPLAIARNSPNVLWNGPSWAFIYFFRGTPLLIQLLPYLLWNGSVFSGERHLMGKCMVLCSGPRLF